MCVFLSIFVYTYLRKDLHIFPVCIDEYSVFSVKHTSSSCPVDLSPPNVVVRFGDPLWANCRASTDQILGMGWESSQGGRPLTNGVTSLDLNISSVTDWGLVSFCFINRPDGTQCTRGLSITVYSKPFIVINTTYYSMMMKLLKYCGISLSLSFFCTETPDKVSISGLTSRYVEGQTYEMQCHIFNVAPAKKLLVHWYKGNEIIATKRFDEPTPGPVNKSAALELKLHGGYHGSVIWCEAEMDLGTETDAPTIRSEAHRMEVLCMSAYLLNFALRCVFYSSHIFHPSSVTPAFHNATDEELEMREGSPLLLNCSASGNPAPLYSWTFPDPIQLSIKNQSADQPLLEPLYPLPGVYTCRVSNSLGTATKAFTVTEAESKTSQLNPASFLCCFWWYFWCRQRFTDPVCLYSNLHCSSVTEVRPHGLN